jgi:hypothetical protein
MAPAAPDPTDTRAKVWGIETCLKAETFGIRLSHATTGKVDARVVACHGIDSGVFPHAFLHAMPTLFLGARAPPKQIQIPPLVLSIIRK